MLDLHDSRQDLTYVWNESHTVNVYQNNQEIDCFTFGFNANGTTPTFDEFVAAVNRRMEEYV